MPEPPPLGDSVDSDPTPFQLPHHYSVGRSDGGPGYPRHRDGLDSVTHSFPPSHQGGRGTIKGSNRLPSQQPSKRMNPTPLSKDTCRNAKRSRRAQKQKCPHAGVLPTCLTIQRSYPPTWKYTDPPEVKWTPTPSLQRVDGAGLSTAQHWLTRPSHQGQHQPAG